MALRRQAQPGGNDGDTDSNQATRDAQPANGHGRLAGTRPAFTSESLRLVSERPERDRGFESLRFRRPDQRRRYLVVSSLCVGPPGGLSPGLN